MNKIILGNCLDKLKDLESNSVDSIVTDPPYELGFMGKKWDNTGIANNKEMWKECLRVLKPGGHMLAFSGTRTYHRMSVAIEDAGFEVRDMIEWVYGSGFPKSLNIGKAVDKIAPRLGQFDDFAKHLTEQIKSSGKSQKEISILFPSKTGGLTGCVWNWANGANVPTVAQWNILKPLLDLSDDYLPLIERIEREREVVGKAKSNAMDCHKWLGEKYEGHKENIIDVTKGTSEYEGWGTALKPAHEPICMARKPLECKTVAENCLKWGTGGINIDESRVGTEGARFNGRNVDSDIYGKYGTDKPKEVYDYGRFPANLILEDCEEVRACFPNESERFFKSIIYQAKASKSERNKGCEGLELRNNDTHNNPNRMFQAEVGVEMDKSTRGANQNNHPTVKPIALMEYLIKMVTPKGGIVLDPFAGSGTTLVASKMNGFQYIGIEMTEEYIPIIEARLNSVKIYQKELEEK